MPLTSQDQSWMETVLATQPRVAVFDCDGTLWGPDSGFGFMNWSLEQGMVSPQASQWLAERYREYRAGVVDEATMCGEMVQVYAGLRVSELRQAAARFFAGAIEPKIFPVMEALVRELHASGTEIWAVSSTCNWVVEAGVEERFGIAPERVLAACVRVQNGFATGELLAVPTDEAKASALIGAGVPRPDAVFGNSIHDLAMLELAAHPYPVNPTEALLEVAQNRSWRVLHPDRGEQVLPAANPADAI